MKKSEIIRQELDERHAYYKCKFEQYKKMDMNEAKTLRRLERLTLHSNLTTKLLLEFNETLFYELWEDFKTE